MISNIIVDNGELRDKDIKVTTIASDIIKTR